MIGMVAKVVAAFLVIFVIVAIALAVIVPRYYAYRDSVDEREHERELRELERDEALVREAEREFEDPKS